MDDPFDSENFLITFPLWFPAHQVAEADGLIRSRSTNAEIGTPVFTDRDLAERFLESVPGIERQYTLRPIIEAVAFLQFLKICETRGITHIAIDQSLRRARYHPIQDLRRSIQEHCETPEIN